MPRLSTRVPKFSRQKQRNLAFVRLDGKQRYLGHYDDPTSREKYDRLISIWIANGRKLPPDWKKKIELPSHPGKQTPTGMIIEKPSVTSSIQKPNEALSHETTIGEVIAEYVPFTEKYYGGNRTFEQIVQMAIVLRSTHERTAAAAFGPEHLHELRNNWVVGGWGRKHTNDMANRVVAMFRWAAEKSASPSSRLKVALHVWQVLKTVRGLAKGRPLFNFDGSILYDIDGQVIIPHEGKIPPPVDSETVNRTLKFLPTVVADMVLFQQATGCRPGETCQLRPQDVDRSSADVWLYRPSTHKTEHVESDDGRVIAIGLAGQKILAPYFFREESAFCFSPRESEQKRRLTQNENRKTPHSCGNRVGSNRKSTPKRVAGEVYSVSAYNKAIKRAVEKANKQANNADAQKIEPWSANQLRKAYALKIRNEKELGLDHSQVVLGHKQRATTEKWYARNQAAVKAVEVAKKIG